MGPFPSTLLSGEGPGHPLRSLGCGVGYGTVEDWDWLGALKLVLASIGGGPQAYEVDRLWAAMVVALWLEVVLPFPLGWSTLALPAHPSS